MLVGPGTYDTRGNRIEMVSRQGDSYTDTFDYADGGVQDRLVRWNRHSSTPAIEYTYDLDGRLATMTLPPDSSGQPSYTEVWTGAGPASQGSGGLDSVYKSVNVGGAVYEYYYDANNRRRLKEYPTGVTDEYFYSARNELLVDRGNAALSSPAYSTADEYVRPEGRPMMVLRGRLDMTTDARASDSTTACGRNGESQACGAYFIIADDSPKPVALLDANGRHARKLDWDFFGSVNRTPLRGVKTPHPYWANLDWAFFNMSPLTNAGMSVEYRYQFDVLDTEGTAGAPVDAIEIRQNWEPLLSLGGHHRGRVFSPWVVQDGGWMSVAIKASPRSCPPEGCLADGGLPDGGSWPYTGADLVAYELAERQTGARPFDIPLRFPGQYFDAETQKHENWNRFYDPEGGRYLSPEPLLQSPTYVRRMAQTGMSVPTYAYALNNPIFCIYIPTGLYGTNSCEYYAEQCLKSGGDYYCKQAPFWCEKFPKEPDPDPSRDDDDEGWARCTRKCLQDCDALEHREDNSCPVKPDDRKGPWDPRSTSFTCHVACYSWCGAPSTPIEPNLPLTKNPFK